MSDRLHETVQDTPQLPPAMPYAGAEAINPDPPEWLRRVLSRVGMEAREPAMPAAEAVGRRQCDEHVAPQPQSANGRLALRPMATAPFGELPPQDAYAGIYRAMREAALAQPRPTGRRVLYHRSHHPLADKYHVFLRDFRASNLGLTAELATGAIARRIPESVRHLGSAATALATSSVYESYVALAGMGAPLHHTSDEGGQVTPVPMERTRNAVKEVSDGGREVWEATAPARDKVASLIRQKVGPGAQWVRATGNALYQRAADATTPTREFATSVADRIGIPATVSTVRTATHNLARILTPPVLSLVSSTITALLGPIPAPLPETPAALVVTNGVEGAQRSGPTQFNLLGTSSSAEEDDSGDPALQVGLARAVKGAVVTTATENKRRAQVMGGVLAIWDGEPGADLHFRLAQYDGEGRSRFEEAAQDLLATSSLAQMDTQFFDEYLGATCVEVARLVEKGLKAQFPGTAPYTGDAAYASDAALELSEPARATPTPLQVGLAQEAINAVREYDSEIYKGWLSRFGDDEVRLVGTVASFFFTGDGAAGHELGALIRGVGGAIEFMALDSGTIAVPQQEGGLPDPDTTGENAPAGTPGLPEAGQAAGLVPEATSALPRVATDAIILPDSGTAEATATPTGESAQLAANTQSADNARVTLARQVLEVMAGAQPDSEIGKLYGTLLMAPSPLNVGLQPLTGEETPEAREAFVQDVAARVVATWLTIDQDAATMATTQGGPNELAKLYAQQAVEDSRHSSVDLGAPGTEARVKAEASQTLPPAEPPVTPHIAPLANKVAKQAQRLGADALNVLAHVLLDEQSAGYSPQLAQRAVAEHVTGWLLLNPVARELRGGSRAPIELAAVYVDQLHKHFERVGPNHPRSTQVLPAESAPPVASPDTAPATSHPFGVIQASPGADGASPATQPGGTASGGRQSYPGMDWLNSLRQPIAAGVAPDLSYYGTNSAPATLPGQEWLL